MPQKKNAYPFEYVRSRAAHAIGDMTSAYGTIRAASFQDLKDVEEEVVTPVFRSLEEASRALRLLDGAIPSLEVRRDVMLEEAATSFASSTELAAAIHRRSDFSLRTAHRIVANLVLRADRSKKNARDVDLALLNESAREVIGHELDLGEEDVRKALDPRNFVESHAVPGGPAPARVREAIAEARNALAERAQSLDDARAAVERARDELGARVASRREAVA